MSKIKLFVPIMFFMGTCYLSGNDLRNTEVDGYNSSYQQNKVSEGFLPLEILIYSAQGEWVGQGRIYHFQTEKKPFFLTKWGNASNVLSFSVFLDDWDSWGFEFVGPTDIPLEIRDYLAVERFPFQSTGHPGMNVDGFNRGCNSILGSFRIWDIRYDENGAVNCLALDFVQYCVGNNNPLTGSIRFNSNISHSLNEEIISYLCEELTFDFSEI